MIRDALHGRGARTNTTGRFERFIRVSFDDGWGADEALAPLETIVTPELAKSIISTNQSPDISFGSGLSIVYIFTDQERYHAKWPKGLSLPAHERLQRTGTSFVNHYGAATMCTPSRSVMMTGLQTVDNKMFDNTDTPYIKSLSKDIPTIGKMTRGAGYYAAYKGKWHLTQAFDTDQIERFFTKEMEEMYGFSDFFSPGDFIGHTLGGYSYDQITASSAVNWLRTKRRPLSDDGKPWSLFISFVNPHDVMYFNTDAPGEKVQDTGKLLLKNLIIIGIPHPGASPSCAWPYPAGIAGVSM